MVRLGPNKPLKTFNIRNVIRTCSLVTVIFDYEEETFIKDKKTGEMIRRILKLTQNDRLIVKCDSYEDAQQLTEMLSQYRI